MKANGYRDYATKILLTIVVFFALIFITQYFLLGSTTLVAAGDEASQADLAESELMLGKEFVEPTLDPYQQLLQSPANPVGVTFSEEQFSAHIMTMHPISQVTTQFGDNSFEISGVLDRKRLPGFMKTLNIKSLEGIPLLSLVTKFAMVDPTFYFKGLGGVYLNDVKVEVHEAKIGKFTIDNETAGKLLEEYFELVLRQAPAFSAQDVTLQPDFMWFYGTATKVVPRY